MQPPEAPPLDPGGQGSAGGSAGAVAGARGNRSGTGAGTGAGSGSADGYGLLEGPDGGHTSATPSSKRKAPPPPPPPKSDEAEKAGTSGNHQKRRRRVFSCQSCQRLKCRCEYDPGAQACHRCVTLRYMPRLPAPPPSPAAGPPYLVDTPSIGLSALSRGRYSTSRPTPSRPRMGPVSKKGTSSALPGPVPPRPSPPQASGRGRGRGAPDATCSRRKYQCHAGSLGMKSPWPT